MGEKEAGIIVLKIINVKENRVTKSSHKNLRYIALHNFKCLTAVVRMAWKQ